MLLPCGMPCGNFKHAHTHKYIVGKCMWLFNASLYNHELYFHEGLIVEQAFAYIGKVVSVGGIILLGIIISHCHVVVWPSGLRRWF